MQPSHDRLFHLQFANPTITLQITLASNHKPNRCHIASQTSCISPTTLQIHDELHHCSLKTLSIATSTTLPPIVNPPVTYHGSPHHRHLVTSPFPLKPPKSHPYLLRCRTSHHNLASTAQNETARWRHSQPQLPQRSVVS